MPHGRLRGRALAKWSREIRACWESTREARARPAAAISGYRPIDRPYQRGRGVEAGKDAGNNAALLSIFFFFFFFFPSREMIQHVVGGRSGERRV
ncbi:hypothetical protein L209DRAFT_755708 [Thermothelomyces heterothallicus CBS 203.75]